MKESIQIKSALLVKIPSGCHFWSLIHCSRYRRRVPHKNWLLPIDALVEAKGTEVGTEVDGPSHFVGRKATGRTLLKRRQVTSLDEIAVVSVPYWGLGQTWQGPWEEAGILAHLVVVRIVYLRRVLCYVTLWLSFTMRRLRHRCFKNKRTSHMKNIVPQFVEEGGCHPPDYGMHNIIYRERMDGWK